ncbi:MAG: peptidoglycan-binding domain-containing protein [Bacillota bacterium]
MEELTPSGQTTGILEVKVFGANEAEPIPHAKVTVNELVKDASGKDVPGRKLAVVKTEDTGNAPSLQLPAPPAGSEIPYSPYMLTVEAPGAQPKIIQGVQVFPTGPKKNRALQHVSLSPAPVPALPPAGPFMEESLGSPDSLPMTPTIEVIPPHSSVWEPERRLKKTQRGELPLPTPVQDPAVLIPDQITVHMGPVSTRVQNITVSTLEYFRKVASHEINPDYHVEAIRANVIAIMSYTLNRIYTEYYKWFGYDFDITGVKQDQVFNPSQTLQSKIVDVVDDIFGQFIAQPRFKAPIRSEYGRTPVPDTIYQRKANELAHSGKNHMEIIKHFYSRKFGQLELRTATPIGGKFITYPGRDLKEGNSGPDVQYLQRRLKSLEKTFWAIRVIGLVEDGIFGRKTTDAVKVFQSKILGIPATGVVNRSLWNRLNEYYWPRVPEDRQMISPNGYWAAPVGYCPAQTGYRGVPTGYPTISPYLTNHLSKMQYRQYQKRNYYPLSSPPSQIPSSGYKYKDLTDFYNFFANWVYIWLKEPENKNMWLFPTYIGLNRLVGYIWNDNNSSPEPVEIINPVIEQFFPESSSPSE